MRILLLFVAALLVGGCAPQFFPPAPQTAVPAGRTAAALATADWVRQPGGPWLLQQEVEFDFHGRQLLMRGLLQLDGAGETARLVAVDPLGIKLFDLEVTATGETVHYLLPQLARYPQLGKAVATSVRRMFLVPRPAAGDALSAQPDSYELRRPDGAGEVTFAFAGPQARLATIRVSGEGRDWQVGYYDYHRDGELEYPARILLEDRVAGYRLQLKIDSMRHSE